MAIADVGQPWSGGLEGWSEWRQGGGRMKAGRVIGDLNNQEHYWQLPTDFLSIFINFSAAKQLSWQSPNFTFLQISEDLSKFVVNRIFLSGQSRFESQQTLWLYFKPWEVEILFNVLEIPPSCTVFPYFCNAWVEMEKVGEIDRKHDLWTFFYYRVGWPRETIFDVSWTIVFKDWTIVRTFWNTKRFWLLWGPTL